MSIRVQDLIKKANNIQIGTGLIILPETNAQLLPVLQSAIKQCGFSGSLNNMLWSKVLPDGQKTALVIYCHNDNSPVPLDKIANYGRSIVILSANGNSNMKTPIVIDKVYKSSSEDSAIQFDVLNGAFGAVARCEFMFEIEHRIELKLSPHQVKAVEATQQASGYLYNRYFIIASPSHQHQLALLLDNITPYFHRKNEKQISLVRFRKDTPANIPCLIETLKRVGIDAAILFKATNDYWICYYIFVDNLLQLLAMTKYIEVFRPLFPWMLGLDPPCWKFTETLLNHPNNAHIKEEIRFVMKVMQHIHYLGGNPERCPRHENIHKTLM